MCQLTDGLGNDKSQPVLLTVNGKGFQLGVILSYDNVLGKKVVWKLSPLQCFVVIYFIWCASIFLYCDTLGLLLL